MNSAPQVTEVTRDALFQVGSPKANTANRAIVFVHGLKGDKRKTWSAKDDATSFLGLIASDQDLVDFDTFAFSYRTSFLAGDTVDQIARQLEEEIHRPLAGYHVILVGHSLGGLVCMQYILNRLTRGHSLPVLGLLMYGTPTTGVELVQIAELIGFALQVGFGPFFLVRQLWKRHGHLAQLGVASELLQRLHDGWALRVVNGGDPREDASRRTWLPVRMITGTTDWVVPEHSAKGVYGEIDWHPIPYGHIELVKPATTTDRRYSLAKEFFEICRASKDPAILSQLRSISDSVWKAQHGKIIRDWEYQVEIHGGSTQLVHSRLREAGFAGCTVKQCKYVTVLEGQEVVIGLSFGQIARTTVWTKRPFYVHQMTAAMTNRSDRSRLDKAVNDLLDQLGPDDTWSIFFPRLEVTVSRVDSVTKWDLVDGKIERDGTSLTKSYNLPNEAMDLLGHDIVFNCTYDSVIPESSTSFNLIFPWLTAGFRAQVTVHGELEFVTINHWLLHHQDMTSQLEPMEHRSEVDIRTPDLILPDSAVEIRWNKKRE
jgi:pimeloyl-ACP methyl ester carboxylesterase